MARTKKQSTKFAKRKPFKSTKAKRKLATVGAVKRMISSNMEKKEFVYSSYAQNWTCTAATSYNLNYHGVSRGTGELNFLGNSYKVKSIEVRFECSNYNSPTLSTGTVPVKFMCMILRTKVYKTVTSLSISEIFDENISTVNSVGSFFRDTDKCKILARKTVTVTPDPSSTRAAVRSKTAFLRCSPNTTFHYRDFDSSYEGQHYNYYAVIVPIDYPSSGTIVSYRGDVYTRVMFADS